MANIKFSAFNTETNSANVDFLVGYQGTTMKKISPSNLSSVTSLNDLSDVVVNNTDENAYFINIPSSRSGDLGNLGIGKDSLNALTSGDYNTAIGDSTLNNLTTSEGATAIGFNAGAAGGSNLMAGTTLIGRNAGFGRSGYRNVAIGDSPMGFGSGKTGVNKNTAIGYHALYRIDTDGVDNIAIGHEASQFLTTADGNIAIGDNAARSSTSNYHISIGYEAGYSQTSGANNTNIGYQAGYSTTTAGNNTHFGYQAGRYHNTTGNVLIGDSAGGGTAWGLSGGTAIGQNAGLRLEFGDGVVAVGRNAAQGATGSQAARQGSVFIGDYAGSYANSNFNTVVGAFALYGVDNTSNPNKTVAVGYQAAYAVTTGDQNTAVGYQAGKTITTGNNITVIGHQAEPSSATTTNEITLGDANVALLRIPGLGSTDGHVLTYSTSSGGIVLAAAGGGGGASDLNGLSDVLIDGTSNYFVNIPAGLSGNPADNLIIGSNTGTDLTSGTKNVIIGKDAGENLLAGTENTMLGVDAGTALTNGSRNTFLGSSAGFFTGNSIVDVVAIGYKAGTYAAAGTAIAIGREAGRNNSGNGRIDVGYRAGYSNSSGGWNLNIGYFAGYSNTTGSENTVIGTEAGINNTGSSNTFLGYQAAYSQTSGSNNTALGFEAGKSITIGGSNVVIGYQAMDANTDGDDNVAIGANALGAATSDGRTVAIGVNALKLQNQTFSPMNTAVGYAADDANVSGFGRTCIGGSSGGGATGDNITNIGYQAVTSTSSVSNEITLGNSSVTSLRCAVTSITSLSDERDKSEIKDLEYGLNLIDALQPREFVWDNRVETDKEGKEFFSSNKGKKDFGFIAQEVQALDNDTLRLVYDENPEKLELSYGKLVPVLVKAIQDLSAKVTALENA